MLQKDNEVEQNWFSTTLRDVLVLLLHRLYAAMVL